MIATDHSCPTCGSHGGVYPKRRKGDRRYLSPFKFFTVGAAHPRPGRARSRKGDPRPTMRVYWSWCQDPWHHRNLGPVYSNPDSGYALNVHAKEDRSRKTRAQRHRAHQSKDKR